MVFEARTDIDWHGVKARYEKGETPTEIVRAMDLTVTRQAIENRARNEGWKKPKEKDGPTRPDPMRPFPEPHSDEALRIIITTLGDGSTFKHAAESAGMTADQLYKWRQRDAEIERLCTRAMADSATGPLGNLQAASARGDPKSAQTLMDRIPAAKKEYATEKTGKDAPRINVILNVTRGTAAATPIINGRADSPNVVPLLIEQTADDQP